MDFVQKHRQIILALGLLSLLTVTFYILSIQKNEGHFVYEIDDPFIHMAISKHLVQHGVWGVDRWGFSSASSSPLWTLILSADFLIFGNNVISPFILNFIFASILLIICNNLLIMNNIRNPTLKFLILISIIFFTPLLPLMFCGQEHIIHTVLTIMFAFLAAKIISKNENYSKSYYFLLILAPILTFSRYEGLFLVLTVCIFLLLKKRFFQSVWLGLNSLLPIVIFGIISMQKGWYFLPNSILLKGNTPGSFTLSGITHFFVLIPLSKLFDVHGTHILFLLSAAIFTFIFRFVKKKMLWEEITILLVLFIAAVILHVLFASLGTFYRYESYLVAFGIMTLVVSSIEFLPLIKDLMGNFRGKLSKIALVGAFVIFLGPFLIRAFITHKKIVPGTNNIYEQQYQMGRFLHRYYEGEEVAANDIGAINYLSDIKCFDIWGLSNMDVAKSIRMNKYNSEQINNFTKQENVKIAIVYDKLLNFYGGKPSGWTKIGEWTIHEHVTCFSVTVSFYSVDPSEKDSLINKLKSFSTSLPKDVIQTGLYME